MDKRNLAILVVAMLVSLTSGKSHPHVNGRKVPAAVLPSANFVNVTDGYYRIQNVEDGLFIGAFQEVEFDGHTYPPAGELTSETHDSNGNQTVEDALVWYVQTSIFDVDPYTEIRTKGPNNWNTMEIDLPGGPGSFPVSTGWRILDSEPSGNIVLNKIGFFFDDDQNLCLLNNGLHANISLVACDFGNSKQQWLLVPVA